MKYKSVYICCSEKDCDEGKSLIPNKSIVSIIKKSFEKTGIKYKINESGGFEKSQDVVKAIKESQVLLFISSRYSNNSEECINELSTAKVLGKEILVLSLDTSLFDDRVILFLSALDKIDYHVCPERAIEKLMELLKEKDEDNAESIKGSQPILFSEQNRFHSIKSDGHAEKEFSKSANSSIKKWDRFSLLIRNHLKLNFSGILVALLAIILILCCYLVSQINGQKKAILKLTNEMEQLKRSISTIEQLNHSFICFIEEEKFRALVSEKDLISVTNAIYVSNSEVRITIKNKTQKQIKKIYLEDGYMHYLGEDYDMVPIEEVIDGNEEKTIMLKLHYRSTCSHTYEELSFNSGTLWVEFFNGEKYQTNRFNLKVSMLKKHKRDKRLIEKELPAEQ